MIGDTNTSSPAPGNMNHETDGGETDGGLTEPSGASGTYDTYMLSKQELRHKNRLVTNICMPN